MLEKFGRHADFLLPVISVGVFKFAELVRFLDPLPEIVEGNIDLITMAGGVGHLGAHFAG